MSGRVYAMTGSVNYLVFKILLHVYSLFERKIEWLPYGVVLEGPCAPAPFEQTNKYW